MTSCPNCKCPFSDAEILAIRQSYASRQRKTKSGGKNGGRRRPEFTCVVVGERPVAQLRAEPMVDPPVRETQQERLVVGHGYATQIFTPAEPGDEEWQDRVLVPIEDL